MSASVFKCVICGDEASMFGQTCVGCFDEIIKAMVQKRLVKT